MHTPKIMSSLQDTLSSLVKAGATWQPIKTVHNVGDANKDVDVCTLSNIRYTSSNTTTTHSEQMLDVTFPNSLLLDTTNTNVTKNRPVLVFLHGGGWSRGAKDSPFYGAPSMCQQMTALTGCLSIAPGYRRGTYPDFMRDAAAALRWVKQVFVERLGSGDDANPPQGIFLAGHSAGAHMASLLVLRWNEYFVVGEQDISLLDFVRGLILVSGVYDLFCPLRKAPLDAKNKAFVVAYVLPAFGSDDKVRREASPLLLLNPDKDTSCLGTAAMSIQRRLSSDYNNDNDNEKVNTDDNDDGTRKDEIQVTRRLPRTLILNASFDMGLQENGKLMAEAMAAHTSVQYKHISWTDHASICWNKKTFAAIQEFMALDPTEEEVTLE